MLCVFVYRWYYGNINRQKAESLLLASQNKTGSFLVRISESHSDEYTISGLFFLFSSPSISHTLSFEWLEVFTHLLFSQTSLASLSSFFAHLQFSV